MLVERMKALAFLAALPIDSPEERTPSLTAAAAGDLAAFELLMGRYERLVLGTALRLVGNMADAQDVSQEVFLRLYRNLTKVESSESLAGWLYRVTVNASHDLRRRRPAAEPIEHASAVAAAGRDPQQDVVETERRRVLAMSLRVLSEKERAALVLRDLQGLSTEEVAQVLGSSEATVRSQISKARVKVKNFVERYFRRRT